jgi:hypothetical protein
MSPGISIDFDAIQMEMSQENRDSPRSLPSAKNQMMFNFSWDFEGKTTGTPIFYYSKYQSEIR